MYPDSHAGRVTIREVMHSRVTSEMSDSHVAPVVAYLANLAPTGRRAMASRLRVAAEMLGGTVDSLPWHLLRYPHFDALRVQLVERYPSPATVNMTLSAVRGVLRQAFLLGLLPGEEYERLKAVKPATGERLPAGRALSGGEIAALMSACPDTPLGHRDAALIALLFTAGLRRGEAVDLELEHYEGGELRVMGKGRRERLMYISNGARDALEDWIAIRGPDPGPLLTRVRGKTVHILRLTTQAVYARVGKLARVAGVKACSPHDLRRSFVSELLERGADISTVQRLAGHASIQTTSRYDRRGEGAKRRAVDLLHLPYRG
jgi:site-specific recombinase XerD